MKQKALPGFVNEGEDHEKRKQFQFFDAPIIQRAKTPHNVSVSVIGPWRAGKTTLCCELLNRGSMTNEYRYEREKVCIKD